MGGEEKADDGRSSSFCVYRGERNSVRLNP